MESLPCIVCGYKPESIFDADNQLDDLHQPYKATCFNTIGHYGSTVFDSFGDEYLEINVCDECLKKASKNKQIYSYNPHKRKYKIKILA